MGVAGHTRVLGCAFCGCSFCFTCTSGAGLSLPCWPAAVRVRQHMQCCCFKGALVPAAGVAPAPVVGLAGWTGQDVTPWAEQQQEEEQLIARGQMAIAAAAGTKPTVYSFCLFLTSCAGQ